MAKSPKDMSDAEYGAYIRTKSKDYAKRFKARQAILARKLKVAKISVSVEEVDAEIKRIAKVITTKVVAPKVVAE